MKSNLDTSSGKMFRCLRRVFMLVNGEENSK